MSDIETRELERRAALGDERAKAFLERARARTQPLSDNSIFGADLSNLLRRSNTGVVRPLVTEAHVLKIVKPAIEEGAACGFVSVTKRRYVSARRLSEVPARVLMVASIGIGAHGVNVFTVGIAPTYDVTSDISVALRNVWPMLLGAFAPPGGRADEKMRSNFLIQWASQTRVGPRAKVVRTHTDTARLWSASIAKAT